MHQVLDKTYRVQATPLGKGFRNAGAGAGANARSKFTVTPNAASSRNARDDSPMSSPEPEAPQLHAELFDSPVKGVNATPGTNRKRRTSSNRLRGTPKPGTSVLTPAKNQGRHTPVWDSEDDLDDEDFGPSPPKTMQFHIPQSRLMKTPGELGFMFLCNHVLTFFSSQPRKRQNALSLISWPLQVRMILPMTSTTARAPV
jgi:DASH complex subunit ASK1